MMPMVRNPVDWDNIDLVVFDMDGTLYDQRRLRGRMLMALAGEAVRSRTLRVPAILQTFRRCRDTLGNQPSANFMSRQYELTAERCGWPIEMVREAVLDWIEQRPLEYLNACIYAGVRQLFEALYASNKMVAIFSDYPAAAKMKALGLKAHLTVSATDEDVGRLKPDPAGLQKIIAIAGIAPRRSLMIGDRLDRDGEAARQIGMKALIRSRHSLTEAATFRSYGDPLFQPVLQGVGAEASAAAPHACHALEGG